MKKYPTYFKRNKFNAKKKQYGGSIYHSTMEANYAAYLDMMKKAANPAQRVVRWERQVKIPLVVKGVLITNWFCDFRVWYADGHNQYEEVKGKETDIYRIKEKLFRALYPKETLLVIKRLP